MLVCVARVYRRFAATVHRGLTFDVRRRTFHYPVPTPISPERRAIGFRPTRELNGGIGLCARIIDLHANRIRYPALKDPICIFVKSNVVWDLIFPRDVVNICVN